LAGLNRADAMNQAGFAAVRGNVERNYRAALRHSWHVRWLRRALPFGIAAALLTVVVADYMPSFGEIRLPGELGKLVIKGTKITMEQPKISGFSSDGRPYEFTANSAAQDIATPDILELKQIHARIQMADKSTVEVTAPRGMYNVKSEMLTLYDDIVLVSTTGYAARLTEAEIDTRKGNVVSDQPVAVKLLNGFLNAKGLNVVDNGEMLRFDHGVSMTLYPEKDTEKAN
jgi:lipopolysaccharide export system protein LptC